MALKEYSGYPVKTGSNAEESGELRAFPAVTVCGLNPARIAGTSGISTTYKNSKLNVPPRLPFPPCQWMKGVNVAMGRRARCGASGRRRWRSAGATIRLWERCTLTRT